MCAVARVWLAGALALTVSATALAQESKSAALAKELSAALDAAKLDSIATKDAVKADVFYGALYFPNTQLLVVAAQYSAPLAMNERLAKKDYREAYLDLSSASVPGSKVFIEDVMIMQFTQRGISDTRVGTGNKLFVRNSTIRNNTAGAS